MISLNDKKVVRSGYRPTPYREPSRLEVQAENTKAGDIKALEYAMSVLKGKTSLIALDVGCAQGVVSRSRLGRFEEIESVVGIDISHHAIGSAMKDSDSRFSFLILDIESHGAEHKLKEALDKKDRSKFDIIFSSLTLLHLKNPINTLHKLYNLLNPGGVIIIRGSDDGTKIGYPDDDNLIDNIIKETASLPNISDRFNSRKLYFQLLKSKFRNLKLFHFTKDTSEMNESEKLALFDESFSYRNNPISELIKAHPGNQKWIDKSNWMVKALSQLEEKFKSEDFYYMEQDIVIVGQKGEQ